MPPTKSRPPENPPAPRKLFLRRHEVARALGVTDYEVLALERRGELTPRRGANGYREYASSAVAALAARRSTEKKRERSPGEIEAAIVLLVRAGTSDADIVAALRAPFELVTRVRAATLGDDDRALALATETLERERADRRARLLERRKERRS